ncbi:MAG: cell division protein FtsZ [Rhizobiaceae bacterium]|nr:cell division protein FtsZ [Rhizobiaceae bacterium]
MTINLQKPDITELKPRITVYGVGGGGGNAVNNMIVGGLEGVEFVVANTDAQALTMSKAERVVQMGIDVTEGLGAGSQPEVGRAAAEECLTELTDHLSGTHMAFVTAGMGGGTGTGAAPVVARAARELGILTVGVVTKPFHFEGARRMRIAEAGISELQKNVDTLIVIPNQNLFRIANDKTTFADAFGMADQVLYSGVACITDLMVKEGLINLDFADVRSVMNEMGKAMMGTGEASGDGRAIQAAEAAISNPLLDESSMLGAQGLLISITGGRDMTLFEVDEAATRIREEVDADANIILGATFDENLEGTIRVSVVATGIDSAALAQSESESKSLPSAIGSLTSNTTSPGVTMGAPATPSAPAADKAVEKIEQVAKSLGSQKQPAKEPVSATSSVEKNGVRIEPFQPQSSVFSGSAAEEEFRNALEDELMPKDGQFIPPSAETVAQTIKTQEIPKASDFPPIAQAEIDAKTQSSTRSEDRGPMGLLKKLKTGLGLDGDNEDAVLQKAAPTPVVEPTVQAPTPQVANSPQTNIAPPSVDRVDDKPVRSANTTEQASPYAPKRSGLDQNGRITATVNEEDQLDIPAFLRRQSS